MFDFPAVTRHAHTYIEKYGLENRISTLSGDFTKDDLGCGYDLIWASGTLNFSKPFLEQIMTKICKALAPGGICVSIHDQLDPDGTGPAVSVRRYLPMALAGNDFYLEVGCQGNEPGRISICCFPKYRISLWPDAAGYWPGSGGGFQPTRIGEPQTHHGARLSKDSRLFINAVFGLQSRDYISQPKPEDTNKEKKWKKH